MTNRKLTAVDAKTFLQELKDVQPNTSRGVAYVLESLKRLGSSNFSCRAMRFVVESASGINDNELSKFANKWRKTTNSILFDLYMVNESLETSNKAYDKELNTQIETVLEKCGDDEALIVESIALNDTLSKWKLNKNVFEIIQKANKTFYRASDKSMQLASVTHPIGFSVEKDENNTLTAFDGMVFNYNKEENKINIDATASTEVLKTAQDIKAASKYYIKEAQAYVFNTALGVIKVNETIQLNGQNMTLRALSLVLADYYKLNAHSKAKAEEIKMLDFVLSLSAQIVANYEHLSIFSNVLITENTPTFTEYLVILGSGRYALIHKTLEAYSNSYTTKIAHYDSIVQAIGAVSNSLTKAELAETFKDEIAKETEVETLRAAKLKELEVTKQKIDNALIATKEALSALNDDFISRDKVASLKEKTEQLKALRLQTLEEIAKVAAATSFETESSDAAVNEAKDKDALEAWKKRYEEIKDKESEDAKLALAWIKHYEDGKEKPVNENLNTKDTLSKSQIRTAEDYLKSINLSRDVKIPTELPEDGRWSETQEINIDTSKLGQVSPIFKSIDLKVNFSFEPNSEDLYINFRYEYSHNSMGSNGNTPAVVISKNGKLRYQGGYMNIRAINESKVNESHASTRKEKIAFIQKYEADLPFIDMTDEEIQTKYEALEKEHGYVNEAIDMKKETALISDINELIAEEYPSREIAKKTYEKDNKSFIKFVKAETKVNNVTEEDISDALYKVFN